MNSMKNKALATVQNSISIGRAIYLDANILIYLHPPLGKVAPEAASYASFVSLARSSGVKLRVSNLILSEYINTYARLIFNSLYKTAYANKFKAFRKSADWPLYAKQISSEVMSILSYCEVQHTLADNTSLTAIIQDFSIGSFDFNDQLIIEGCQLDSAALLTHDGDMEDGGIIVVTNNPKLLSACP